MTSSARSLTNVSKREVRDGGGLHAMRSIKRRFGRVWQNEIPDSCTAEKSKREQRSHQKGKRAEGHVGGGHIRRLV